MVCAGFVYQTEDDLPLIGLNNGISVVNRDKVGLLCLYYELHYCV